jgi:hypothetical protein
MFPDYMNDMLREACCGHCNAPLSTADIQIVGVRRPEEFEAFYGEPVFVIIMGCKACGQWTNHMMRRSLADSIQGISGFVKLIEKECEGKEPILKIPGLTKRSPAAEPPRQLPQPVDGNRPRPSILPGHPNGPMMDAEVKAFIFRTNKTSFRVGSNGFKKWLKHFGIDPNGEQK